MDEFKRFPGDMSAPVRTEEDSTETQPPPVAAPAPARTATRAGRPAGELTVAPFRQKLLRRRAAARVRVDGKFFRAGAEKFHPCGVTYGPFRPRADGSEYHDAATVERDFAQMVAHGINAVRTYTVPPRWLLNLARDYGLGVLVGLPWEQHITLLDDAPRVRRLADKIEAAVATLAGHPALLGWTIGNEIPSSIVRWHGHRRTEDFLERLYRAAKRADPDGLVTYVNYPSTEYLELPFLDFVSFNVYLEKQERLEAYTARLQNLAGERPLLMAEIGLDSGTHGVAGQAEGLAWQMRTLFAQGCAGLFLFAWTDEWHRGGHDIEDWHFGLTTRMRAAKPALEAAHAGFRSVPFSPRTTWPPISVVICSFNGAETIGDALAAAQQLRYSNFEIIVVDDGSTDQTAAIAQDHGVRVIRQRNRGLSAARNAGWRAARGEIVAFLDDDAAPDPHWLQYLAHAFTTSDFAGIGGPNIAFPTDGFAAHCVDHAPGNPTHVLLTDRVAEHLPGCNMAYRRACLEAIGGFDAQFRIAGDDVDFCWRLQERGWRLGFHPGAMVWHHRRGTIRGYWRQQFNYGRAEAMLERKWPEKYNAAGHARWHGRLYDKGCWMLFQGARRRIYHGSWGSALFQRVYQREPGTLQTILMMPEWYVLMALLATLSRCGLVDVPLRYTFGLLGIALGLPLARAARAGWRTTFRPEDCARWSWWRLATTTALLHWLQPLARGGGRLKQGLTPWRRHGTGGYVTALPRTLAIWSETHWRSADQRLTALEAAARARGGVVARGGDCDGWDLEARGGVFGAARTTLVIEEHGSSRQLVRLRFWPAGAPAALIAAAVFAILADSAALESKWPAWAVLSLLTLLLLGRMAYECGTAMAAMIAAATDNLPEGERVLSPTSSNEH
jgi:GT2 family glycosyltransferase